MHFAAQLLNFVPFDLLAVALLRKCYAQSRITAASSSPQPAISDGAGINCGHPTNFILPPPARSMASLRNYLTMGVEGGMEEKREEVFTFLPENWFMSNQGGGQGRLNLGSAEGHRPTRLCVAPCLMRCLSCMRPCQSRWSETYICIRMEYCLSL